MGITINGKTDTTLAVERLQATLEASTQATNQLNQRLVTLTWVLVGLAIMQVVVVVLLAR